MATAGLRLGLPKRQWFFPWIRRVGSEILRYEMPLVLSSIKAPVPGYKAISKKGALYLKSESCPLSLSRSAILPSPTISGVWIYGPGSQGVNPAVSSGKNYALPFLFRDAKIILALTLQIGENLLVKI